MRFRRTTLIAVGCFAVLAGLGLSRKVLVEPQAWWLGFVPLAILFRRKNITALILVITLGLVFGLWRGGESMRQLNSLKELTGHKVTIQAVATSDSIYSKNSQIEFTANNIKLASSDKSVVGSFKISGFGLPMVYRGDTIQVSGKLYPMRGANQGRIAYAQLSLVNPGHSIIYQLTRKFSAGMQNALPEPVASFALGLLIGQRSTLPQDILAQLTVVGLVHIVAVSGYNLTIIVRGISRVKLSSKYQQLVLSFALIGLFILMTGFSASIVRAGLVSILSLWAWFYGLKFRPIVLIALAASITGLWSPFYVWGDLGWYLSFLAFFGILVAAPVIYGRLFTKEPKLLTMVVLETLSAEIFTLPLILMTFNQLSIVALLANVLVVPLVPLAMLLATVAGIAGAWLTPIAGWFAWPARILLTYMLDLVHLLANIPSASIKVAISAIFMIIFYALMLFIIFITRKNEKPPRPERAAAASRVICRSAVRMY
jgi:ComEC/Rec2-related protein